MSLQRIQAKLKTAFLQRPHDPILYQQLAFTLHHLGKPNQASRAFELLIQNNPEAGESVLSYRVLDLLLSNQWERAWNLMNQSDLLARRLGATLYNKLTTTFGAPLWKCQQLPQHRILVVGEQGQGDLIQAVRLIEVLQQRQLVVVFCQAHLARLLLECSTIKNVCSSIASIPQATTWIPAMNLLPMLWKPGQDIPGRQEYLMPSLRRVEHWRYYLKQDRKIYLIGLHWQGNPEQEKTNYASGRSIPFETFLMLRGLPNLEFVSLQKFDGKEQLRMDEGLPFVSGQNAVSASTDWRDTAAVLAHCDLVISGDSAIAHLAGAMGVPTWLLLKHIPDWRWGLCGTGTPWYPCITIIRQTCAGDWEGVMTNVRARLEALRWRKTID
ncbi:glycosyltransferase family 9 protein [Synechococcus sp. MIT S1220]|uniref:glycosyltransferase family 9 protein n=1 Tax=Synechococcus sp. MIT S1220 TaxID=3082549 RepID=UPI0039AEE569